MSACGQVCGYRANSHERWQQHGMHEQQHHGMAWMSGGGGMVCMERHFLPKCCSPPIAAGADPEELQGHAGRRNHRGVLDAVHR